MKKSNLQNCFIKESKRIFILLLSSIVFFFIQNSAFADNYAEIPQRVIKFANKHHCTNLKRHTSFKRPFYGYKGYEVYLCSFSYDEESRLAILYKYGIVRFASEREIMQIIGGKEAPPLPIGLWWDYIWNVKRYHLN